MTLLYESRMKTSKIVWYARGGAIAKCGPFTSQVEATNAMRLGKSESFNAAQLFPPNTFVWPEEVEMLEDEFE